MENETIKLSNTELLAGVETLSAEGFSVTLKIQGNSMFPFLMNERDSVVLHPVDRLEKGDIVLARLPNKHYVLHRIQKVTQTHVYLMGDGNIYEDPPCKHSDIVSKAKFIIRNGRQIDCYTSKERLKVHLWNTLKPIRRYLLAIWRRCNKSLF